MDCGESICPEETPKSENVQAIRRNVDDCMRKISDVDTIENQEKYTLALFAKLATAKTIEELANMTIDMGATLQKIQLGEENKVANTNNTVDDNVFIELLK